MANTVISPNMNLPIPVTGVDPGPDYANNVNASLTLVDGHDHSAGNGVPITPSGLNINSALSMNGQSLTTIAALTLQVQGSDAVANSLYEKGVDLYFRDGSGNIIRITQSGSVAGSTGTITGLPSGTASASYAAGTFVFQSATNTSANIDGGSFIFRNNTASSKGLTLQPPNAMGADYSVTLPALPASQKIMTLDASGNMSAPYTVDNSTLAISSNLLIMKDLGTTQYKLALRPSTTGSAAPVGNIAVSPSSSSFTTTSATPVLITNLSVDINTNGRPVMIRVENDGSGSGASFIGITTAGTYLATIYIRRNGADDISIQQAAALIPTSTISFLDTPAAGLYTYQIYMQVSTSGPAVSFANSRLVAYEI